MSRRRTYNVFKEPERESIPLDSPANVEKAKAILRSQLSAEGKLAEYENLALSILRRHGIECANSFGDAFKVAQTPDLDKRAKNAAYLLFRIALAREALAAQKCADAVWNAILAMEFVYNDALFSLENDVGLARHLIRSVREANDARFGSKNEREQRRRDTADFAYRLQEKNPHWSTARLLSEVSKQCEISQSAVKRAAPDIWRRKKSGESRS
jgi:hypothetical protein